MLEITFTELGEIKVMLSGIIREIDRKFDNLNGRIDTIQRRLERIMATTEELNAAVQGVVDAQAGMADEIQEVIDLLGQPNVDPSAAIATLGAIKDGLLSTADQLRTAITADAAEGTPVEPPVE
jgi:hypothetical protein